LLSSIAIAKRFQTENTSNPPDPSDRLLFPLEFRDHNNNNNNNIHYDFQPIAVETLGPINESPLVFCMIWVGVFRS